MDDIPVLDDGVLALEAELFRLFAFHLTVKRRSKHYAAVNSVHILRMMCG